MKCKKCNYKNVSQAKFCYKCGNLFTKSEHELAIKNSIITKLKKIKDVYDTVSLSKITGSIYYKILSIIIVLIIGIIFIFKNGNNFKVINGDTYTYQYNEKLNEYYLFLNKEESNLNLYLPHSVKTFYVSYYNKYNNLISKNTYNNLEDIKIKVDDIENYYKISIDKKENTKNTIKLYAYLKGSVKSE